jgi:ubiquinone/menaquinone biosynthesis C-methylase UbiE
MTPLSAANFDRLASSYRRLEFIAFGGALERARFCFLNALRDCSDILLLGEGDGRALARLAQVAPRARFHYIDSSAAMLARAEARLANHPVRPRVIFTHADILAVNLAAAGYDGVTTFFFLDCFEAKQVAAIITQVKYGLRPGATWLFADFVLPSRKIARLRAQAWLALLYAFFRWQTGIPSRELPPSEELLRQAGFVCGQSCEFSVGLIRSAVFKG